MTYKIAYYMDVGTRDGQEDCIFSNGTILQQNRCETVSIKKVRKEKALFAVCDGMGGHSKGEWASRFVCQRLKTNLKHLQISRDFIELLIEKIQNQIENEMVDNSGTTIAGVALKGNEGTIFNAGDSRVYKITGDDILCMSHDHSLVQSEIDRGFISPSEAFTHPHRNVIEFGIGDVFKSDWAGGNRRIFVREDVLGADEYYLVCTDGVNDVLRDGEILDALLPDPFDRSHELVEHLRKRMKDNFSFILVGSG